MRSARSSRPARASLGINSFTNDRKRSCNSTSVISMPFAATSTTSYSSLRRVSARAFFAWVSVMASAIGTAGGFLASTASGKALGSPGTPLLGGVGSTISVGVGSRVGFLGNPRATGASGASAAGGAISAISVSATSRPTANLAATDSGVTVSPASRMAAIRATRSARLPGVGATGATGRTGAAGGAASGVGGGVTSGSPMGSPFWSIRHASVTLIPRCLASVLALTRRASILVRNRPISAFAGASPALDSSPKPRRVRSAIFSMSPLPALYSCTPRHNALPHTSNRTACRTSLYAYGAIP
ncbi:hypothetical protein ES708_08613 [subsurface metagenome]